LISHDIGREADLSSDKKAPKELKVTDKRIFTADGEIKDEFKGEIRAVEPAPATASPSPVAEEAPKPAPAAAPASEPTPQAAPSAPKGEERRAAADPGAAPASPFAHFLESLILQAYMSLGMMRNPYSPQAKPDPNAARQMIDILTMLKEKTEGNRTPEEDEFLQAHLGELKLAYVQITKNVR
jgi:hypothetical protein